MCFDVGGIERVGWVKIWVKDWERVKKEVSEQLKQSILCNINVINIQEQQKWCRETKKNQQQKSSGQWRRDCGADVGGDDGPKYG